MYKVEGFVFQTEEEARDARREAEGIQYIIAQNNMNDSDIVLKLYNGLIQKDVFSTPVGIAFLRRLRAHLNTIPYIRDEELLPLPVQKARSEAKREDTRAGNETKQMDAAPRRAAKPENTASRSRTGKRRFRGYRIPFWISTFCAVVFALTLIGMFIITAVSKDNVTILNYENAVIDKYEVWEKELNEREIELNAREIELNERELELQEQEKALEENE